jgi:hypothetical protein
MYATALTNKSVKALVAAGIDINDAIALRRISMTLGRWHERLCGDIYGYVDRDEATGKTYWYSNMTDQRFRVLDRESGARKRLAKIMEKYPQFVAYIQGDPTGCALYITPTDRLRPGQDISSYYNSVGIAVCK